VAAAAATFFCGRCCVRELNPDNVWTLSFTPRITLFFVYGADEMYQIVVHMPEDIPFNCRVCCPVRPSPWQLMVQSEMLNGLFRVIDSLLSSNSATLLEPIKLNNVRTHVSF